ncbi:MAG: TonB-dependent receptor [Ignavibacteria bacterium]|jgi:outer membrane receptor protein involved in Fe transport
MLRKIIILLILPVILFAQSTRKNVSGKVYDKSNNQLLSNCNVYIKEISKGTITNAEGFYSIQLPVGKYTIRFSYVGYETIEKTVVVDSSDKQLSYDIYLIKKPLVEDEVTVYGKKDEALIVVQSIETKDIQKMPNIFSDPLRTVQIFSGVSFSNELVSGYNVRGGSYDENLIYLNGYEIYRPFLLKQGFEESQTLVNPDMVDNMKFYNGAFPARFGDKMASALQIKYTAQNDSSSDFKVRADLMNLGVFAKSSLGKFNWMVGARHAYPGLFLDDLQTSGNYRPAFSDLQFFSNYQISDNSKVELLLLVSGNEFDFVPEQWLGHVGIGARGNFSAVTIDYDGNRTYEYNNNLIGIEFSQKIKPELLFDISLVKYWSEEKDKINLISEINYHPDAEHVGQDQRYLKTRYEFADNNLEFNSFQVLPKIQYDNKSFSSTLGLDLKFVDVSSTINETLYELTDTSDSFSPAVNVSNNPDLSSYSIYNENIFKIKDNLIANIGFRYSTIEFSGEKLFSPRFNLLYYLNERHLFSFSYGYYYQPVFQNELRKVENLNEIDKQSQRSIQYVAGWEYDLKKDVKLQIEAYYKDFNNLLPYYMENIQLNYDFLQRLEGYAYGLDVMFKGEIVRGTNSWLGYSYLNSKEKPIGSDSPYRRRLTDQTHTIQIFLQDRMPKHPNWQSHLRFLFGSGFLYHQREIIEDEESGNSYVTVDYSNPKEYLIFFRVDMGLSTKFEISKFFNLTAIAEVLNVFNHYNVVGYEWVKIFDEYNTPTRIPRISSKRFFNIRLVVDF